MPVTRIMLALLFAAALVRAADDQPAPVKADVESLGGKTLRGELVNIDTTDVTLKTDKGEEKVPVVQVLTVTTDRPSRPAAKTYALVQLNDGTEFRCESVEFKKQEVTIKLVSGVSLKVQMKDLKFVLKDAHDKKILDQWQPIISTKNRAFDALIVVNKDDKDRQLNVLDGTFGDIDDEQKTISFVLSEANSRKDVPFANIHAFIFARGPLVNALPQLFRLQDVDGNTVPVAQVSRKDAGYTFTTVGLVKIDYPAEALVKLDFSKGKLTYLSDFEFKEKFNYNLEENQERAKLIFGPVKDKNMNRSGPIRIHGNTYKKGLAVHAYTELNFDVKGEYEWFNTIVGFDDEISGVTTSVIVEVFGDGKELKSVKLDRAADKEPKKLEVNIKDVSQLRIIVRRGQAQSLDFGCGIELGDARVNK